jgi:23S rRNA pseudouridine2605 synthase
MPRPHRRRSSSSKKRVEHDPNTLRINKVLASAGLGSRRDVEELIVQGRVEVDGQTVTNLATRVDPRASKIAVDGVQLKRPQLVYYALNKPKGILSTNNDPSGRARVIDLVPNRHRVFSVGRLDRYSEGLMLLTNDGDIAQRLAHPKFRVQKTYFVVVAGLLTNEELAKLKKGVYLAEGMARIDGARIRKTRKTCTELEILLSEGKNREIRRILARAGHKVVLLRRIAIGPLRMAELPVGAVRELTPNEIKALYACTEQGKPAAKSTKTKRAAATDATGSTTGKPVTTEKIVTPLENTEFDDFGLGLDQDYQYDESVLTPSDDAIEFGASEEEDWDDDFVSDFESLSSGSVLAYDENEDSEPAIHDSKPARAPRERDSRPQSGRGQKPASSREQPASRDRSEGRSFSKKIASGSRDSSGGRGAGSKGTRGFGKKKSAGKRPAGFKGAARPGKPGATRAAGQAEGRSTEGRKPMGRKPMGRKTGGKPGGKSGGKSGGNRKPRG